MQPWLATIGVFLLAFLGIILGLLTIKIKHHLWLLFYILPMAFIIAIGLTRFFVHLSFFVPFSLLTTGRTEYCVYAFSVPLVLGTLIPRVAKKRAKIDLIILFVVSSLYFFIVPFLVPILVRGKLESLQTKIIQENICRQTTNYTCGPASAVTALRRLGIEADEGELAIHAYSTPLLGTDNDLLAAAIKNLYGPQGIRCSYRYFDSIEQLKQNCPAVAAVKFSFFIDHFVAVLEVTDDKVIIGDPFLGKQELTYEEFEKKWRKVGIVLQKEM